MKTQKELKQLLSQKVKDISLAQKDVSLAVAETSAPDLYKAYQKYVSALNALTDVGKKYDTVQGGKPVNQLLNQLKEIDKKLYNMISKYFIPVG